MNAATSDPGSRPYPLRLPLDYTDGTDLKVVHDICVSDTHHVLVVGDPDNGSYEWVLEEADSVTFSNSGYGCSDIALRDGLIAYHHSYGSDECLAVKVAQLKQNSKTVRRTTVTPRGRR
jgi:hypothetical protein